jgi:hypothetical protein
MFRKKFFAGLGLSVLLISSFIILFNCDDKLIVEKPGGFLAGTVTDSISGLPLSGAWASNDSIQDSLDVITDSLGQFVHFSGTPVTNSDVYVGMAEYQTQTKKYSVGSSDTVYLDFKLIRTR